MVRRPLAVMLLVLALAAGGCTGPGSSAPSRPESDQTTPADQVAFELGAWHEVVAGPDGLVLVNGYPEGETDPGPLELWRQTDGGWEAIPTAGDRPTGRNFAAVAIDEGSHHLVLHGGLTADGASAETWLWDGDRWTLAADGDDGPGPRSSPSMAFDEASGLTLLYGGDDGRDQYADTWAFDGTAWEQVATEGPEPVRWPALMETDPDGGVVLYGGHQVVDEDGPIALGDTWVWRGGRWRLVAGADAPGPLVNANGVVHPAHGLLLVGGGDDRGRERGRVWRWTGSSWEAMGSELVPERQAFGLAYDADRDVVVLTGGLVEPGSTDRHQDTWEWSGDPGTPAEQVG